MAGDHENNSEKMEIYSKFSMTVALSQKMSAKC